MIFIFACCVFDFYALRIYCFKETVQEMPRLCRDTLENASSNNKRILETLLGNPDYGGFFAWKPDMGAVPSVSLDVFICCDMEKNPQEKAISQNEKRIDCSVPIVP
jgi:hypothetical protein